MVPNKRKRNSKTGVCQAVREVKLEAVFCAASQSTRLSTAFMGDFC